MASRRKRILTVEDAPNIRKLIAYNLKRAGYDVLEAANGKGAVAVLQKTIPDLIILDIRMPEMDGFQLLELLRRYPKAAAIPVIMMTALSSTKDVDRALSLGVVDYLVKPLDPAMLKSKVESALRNQSVPVRRRPGENRREFVRGSILGVRMAPSPEGEGIHIGEGGIAWRARRAPEVGSVVNISSTALFSRLRMSVGPLRARVVYVQPLRDGHKRVGAAFIGLPENVRDAIRRYVITREAQTVGSG